jgi:enhancing lycopene biosynthesis protein 2
MKQVVKAMHAPSSPQRISIPICRPSPQNFKNRYNKQIRYTRSNNIQVACVVHILSNSHEYSPVDEIVKLAKPCTGRMYDECLQLVQR